MESADPFESATEIEAYCLYECESLRSFDIPGRAWKTSEGAFQGCKSIKELMLPEHQQIHCENHRIVA